MEFGTRLSRPWWDIEVSTLAAMLEIGKWRPHEVSAIRRQIEDRKAQILGGLGSASQIYWTARLRLEVDEDCRVRRDPVQGWMLDRWADPGCWHVVGYIGFGGKAERVPLMDQNGILVDTVRVIDDKVRPDLIQFLKSHDMRRPGYLEEKRAKSLAIRKENERLATDKVLMAVDSLSDKRLKEFVSVEKAIQTGETVTMHGESMRMFERMTEAGKKAPPGTPSMNPGQHPQHITRDYSHGEGESYGESYGDVT